MQQSDYLALSPSRTVSTFLPFGLEYHFFAIWHIHAAMKLASV